jgi:type IV secretion system protein VirD4
MSLRTALLILAVGAAALTALLAWAYLAGYLYFLLNKSLPRHIDAGTWYLYWQAYGGDHGQRLRLIAAAAIPLVPALAAVVFALSGRQRPLYGDARWASEREIRDAGLL